jgi:hypothetical protein
MLCHMNSLSLCFNFSCNKYPQQINAPYFSYNKNENKTKTKIKNDSTPRKPPNNVYGWLKYRHVLQMITYHDTLKDNIARVNQLC